MLVTSSSFLGAARFPLCGADGDVLLAQLRLKLVQVFLCFFLVVEERLEEVSVCGRQMLRPHGHNLDVFLERFNFPTGVLDGAIEHCLGLRGLLALLLVETPRLLLPFACLSS